MKIGHLMINENVLDVLAMIRKCLTWISIYFTVTVEAPVQMFQGEGILTVLHLRGNEGRTSQFLSLCYRIVPLKVCNDLNEY